MPVTNIKFLNRNGSGPETATSVERADVVSTIYNSGSSSSPTLLGEFFISNSSDSGYDISASLRLGERSTINIVTASLLSESATNITESATNFYLTKKGPSFAQSINTYTIKGLDVELKSSNLKISGRTYTNGFVYLANSLLNSDASGYIRQVTAVGDNRGMYWTDSDQWNILNFSTMGVSKVETTSQINEILPASKGGTNLTALFTNSRNSILVGGGSQVSFTGSLLPDVSGSMVISNGTIWKSIKTSSLQFIAETSSYLKPLDFDKTAIAFKSSSGTHGISFSSSLETVQFEFNSKNNINITASSTNINAKEKNISFSAGSIELNSRILYTQNYKAVSSNTVVDLNKPIQIIYRTTYPATASLSEGIVDNQILTFAVPFSDRFPVYLTCSSGVSFASPELSNGYLVTTATQLRYDMSSKKWFRHF